jgi:outer membrane usher protein FimD/PapC
MQLLFSRQVRVITCCTLLNLGAMTTAHATDTKFDVDTLKALGISPAVADYYSAEPRFPSGQNSVTLLVNGNKSVTTSVRFGGDGVPCMTLDVLTRANIEWPRQELAGECLNLKSVYPQATVTPMPLQNALEILVPPESVRSHDPAPIYGTGGNGAMLNYNLFSVRTQAPGTISNTFYADTVLGFNTNDWLFRSHEIYSGQDGKNQFQHQEAYIQHTFPGYKATFQAGQLALRSSLFSAPSFTGAQFFPELQLSEESDTSVSGIAQTPSRVEVRQAGALIYSTLVPSGPFTLSRLPLINGTSDLQVSVIEANGSRHAFIVPAASFANNFVSPEQGWSVALGKPRMLGGDASYLQSTWFVTAMNVMPLQHIHANVTTGLLVAQSFRSAGLAVDGSPLSRMRAYIRSIFADDSRVSSHGIKAESGISASLTKAISVSTSFARQTRGYRELADFPAFRELFYVGTKASFNASVAYSTETFGGFSTGFTRVASFDGSSSNRALFSWNKSFKKVSVSLSADIGTGSGMSNLYFANISFPLGDNSGNLSASALKTGNQSQAGVAYSQQVNDFFGYNVSGAARAPGGHQNYTASLNVMPKYTQIGATAAGTTDGTQSYSVSLTGGVVFDGVRPLFAPYPIGDTYAVMQAADLSGVRIQTPAGPVWTDFSGRAVAPNLMPYRNSRLELGVDGLPRNVEVKDAVNVVDAGRGSIGRVIFKAIRMRHLLLGVRDVHGKPLEGAGVFSPDNAFLTIVGPDSKLFIDADRFTHGMLKIKPDSQPECFIHYTPNVHPHDDAIFESASTVCTEN